MASRRLEANFYGLGLGLGLGLGTCGLGLGLGLGTCGLGLEGPGLGFESCINNFLPIFFCFIFLQDVVTITFRLRSILVTRSQISNFITSTL